MTSSRPQPISVQQHSLIGQLVSEKHTSDTAAIFGPGSGTLPLFGKTGGKTTPQSNTTQHNTELIHANHKSALAVTVSSQ